MIIEGVRLWMASLLYCRIGRRKAILISSAGITLMIAAVALSPNVYAFMAFRFMAGFFTQAVGSVAYCYGRSIEYLCDTLLSPPPLKVIQTRRAASIWRRYHDALALEHSENQP